MRYRVPLAVLLLLLGLEVLGWAGVLEEEEEEWRRQPPASMEQQLEGFLGPQRLVASLAGWAVRWL